MWAAAFYWDFASVICSLYKEISKNTGCNTGFHFSEWNSELPLSMLPTPLGQTLSVGRGPAADHKIKDTNAGLFIARNTNYMSCTFHICTFHSRTFLAHNCTFLAHIYCIL